eukprot:2250765-Pyramimonas_sp.AAC.1
MAGKSGCRRASSFFPTYQALPRRGQAVGTGLGGSPVSAPRFPRIKPQATTNANAKVTNCKYKSKGKSKSKGNANQQQHQCESEYVYVDVGVGVDVDVGVAVDEV